MTVLVVDYGMGNLASVRRALEECGARVRVSADPSSVASAERIVIPGVGAFGVAMDRLRSQGWVEPIRRAALVEGIPLLGICLGMQLLATESEEFGEHAGLGLIPGRVAKMSPHGGERVPHVGWNEVNPIGAQPLFNGIAPGSDFYFVHSYRFIPDDCDMVLSTTPYCGEVVSAVGCGHVCGTQFHPEKSSKSGFQLIRNFLAMGGGQC